jgi:hypothetical protein
MQTILEHHATPTDARQRKDALRRQGLHAWRLHTCAGVTSGAAGLDRMRQTTTVAWTCVVDGWCDDAEEPNKGQARPCPPRQGETTMTRTMTVWWDAATAQYMVTWLRADSQPMDAPLTATTRRTALAEAAEALGVDVAALTWGGFSAAQTV